MTNHIPVFIMFPHSDPVENVRIFPIFPLTMIVGEIYDRKGPPQTVSAITIGLMVLWAAWLLKDESPTDRF